VRLLRPLVERIQRKDRNLADQLKRAATSVVLNLAEGAHTQGGNRRLRFETARGSSNEARAALSVACAWGYVSDAEAAEVDALYDRDVTTTRSTRTSSTEAPRQS
jgi:four helix bundle protein